MLLRCLTGMDRLSEEKAQCKFNVFESPLEKSNLRSCVTCPGTTTPLSLISGSGFGTPLARSRRKVFLPDQLRRAASSQSGVGFIDGERVVERAEFFWIQTNTGLDLDSTIYKPREVGQIS